MLWLVSGLAEYGTAVYRSADSCDVLSKVVSTFGNGITACCAVRDAGVALVSVFLHILIRVITVSW